MARGRPVGSKQSDETKARIGTALRGRKREPFSQEWRDKIGDAHRGRKQDPEVVAKRAASLVGHVVSADTRAKIVASNRATAAAKFAARPDCELDFCGRKVLYKKGGSEQASTLCGPHHNRNVELVAEYGVTLLQIVDEWEKNDGRCSLCLRKINRIGSRRAIDERVGNVDHCHDSNEYRGWICADCNRLLGLARDDVDLLRRATEYLTRKRDRR